MLSFSRACLTWAASAGRAYGLWALGAGLPLLLAACAEDPADRPEKWQRVRLAAGTRAPATPAAERHYTQQVAATLMKEWRKYTLIGSGTLRVRFLLNDGQVERVQIVDASQSFQELTRWTLYCIRNTTFPPMPEALKHAQPEAARGKVWVPFTAVLHEPVVRKE